MLVIYAHINSKQKSKLEQILCHINFVYFCYILYYMGKSEQARKLHSYPSQP